MKKTLLTVAIALAGLSSVFAQGTVYTLNTGDLISTNTGSVSGVTEGNGYYYALLIDSSTPTSSNPLSGGWTFSGVMTTNVNSGLENGGASVVVNGWAANTFVNYEIVGWSTDGGTYDTYAELTAALQNGTTGAGLAGGTFYGVSAEGNAEPGGGTPALGVWHLFGSSASAQGTPVAGFTLNEVVTPEPATMALAAIGGASLLLFRRKK